ncbi:MAG TPA: YCF48-related protein [Polyangiaceae bacterium]
MRVLVYLALPLGGAAIAFVGCGGSSGGSQASASSGAPATFAQVYSTTLGGVCASPGCHNGSAAPGGLDMSDPETAYASLVGTTAAGPACGTSNLTRVVPGDSAHSLLYLKVKGTPPCGSRMPLDLPVLSSAAIAQIKSWIDAGAKNDGTSSGSSSGTGGSNSSGSSTGGSSGSGSGSSTGGSSGSGSSGGGSSSGVSGSSSGISGSSSGIGGSGASGSGGWGAFSGSAGTFGQTFDNVHWSTISVGQQDLLSVSCVGNLHGWVAGTRGVVLHTADGGQTWSAQSSGATADLNAVRFGDLGFGVAAGDGGTVLVTSDGGTHWTTARTSTQAPLRAIAIAGSVAIVVGDGATLLRSTDRGASWSIATIPGAADLHGVATDTAGHLTLAVDGSGHVWRSDDTGASFALETELGAALDSTSVADDGTRALAGGAGGAIFVRDSQGAWQSAFSPTTADLHAVLVGFDVGYAVGQSGTLLSSHDQGATWSWIASGTTATLHGLDDL